MRLGYMPTNTNSTKAGLGFGMAAIGKSITSIGKLADDDKKYNDTLKLNKDVNDRQNKQLKLSQDNFDLKQKEYDQLVEVANDKKNDATTRKTATISLFRKLHPKATMELNDDEVYEFGENIDKLLPKGEDIKKLDTRVTPKGNKILTYESGGKIYEKKLGPVKTEWNSKKASSDIPEGHVSVGKEFYEDYADKGMVKISKDGRFYAPIDFVNQKGQEYIESQHDVGNLKLE